MMKKTLTLCDFCMHVLTAALPLKGKERPVRKAEPAAHSDLVIEEVRRLLAEQV